MPLLRAGEGRRAALIDAASFRAVDAVRLISDRRAEALLIASRLVLTRDREAAVLEEADLAAVDLVAVVLAAVDLAAVVLAAVDLAAVFLAAVVLAAVGLAVADLEEAELEAADLGAADLEEADIEAVDREPVALEAVDLRLVVFTMRDFGRDVALIISVVRPSCSLELACLRAPWESALNLAASA